MYTQRINHILLQDEEHYDPKNNCDEMCFSQNLALSIPVQNPEGSNWGRKVKALLSFLLGRGTAEMQQHLMGTLGGTEAPRTQDWNHPGGAGHSSGLTIIRQTLRATGHPAKDITRV